MFVAVLLWNTSWIGKLGWESVTAKLYTCMSHYTGLILNFRMAVLY